MARSGRGKESRDSEIGASRTVSKWAEPCPELCLSRQCSSRSQCFLRRERRTSCSGRTAIPAEAPWTRRYPWLADRLGCAGLDDRSCSNRRHYSNQRGSASIRAAPFLPRACGLTRPVARPIEQAVRKWTLASLPIGARRRQEQQPLRRQPDSPSLHTQAFLAAAAADAVPPNPTFCQVYTPPAIGPAAGRPRFGERSATSLCSRGQVPRGTLRPDVAVTGGGPSAGSIFRCA